jgi:hypothetical protein
MNSSAKNEARLFNLMKNLKDRKKKKKRKKKNLLSFQGPSPLVCPIFNLFSIFYWTQQLSELRNAFSTLSHLVSVFPLRGLLECTFSIRAGHGSCGWNASHARIVLFHIGTKSTTYIKSIACRCGAPKRVSLPLGFSVPLERSPRVYLL